MMAVSVNGAPEKLAEIDESTGAVLQFDGKRVAPFVTSFNAADVLSDWAYEGAAACRTPL